MHFPPRHQSLTSLLLEWVSKNCHITDQAPAVNSGTKPGKILRNDMSVTVFLNALHSQKFALLERQFHQDHMKIHAEPNILASNLYPELFRGDVHVRHGSLGPNLFFPSSEMPKTPILDSAM